MSKQILVVDDSPMIREMLTLSLTEVGYRVTEAEGGREALSILESKTIDLVLSDIEMPDGDGFSLLSKIRTSLSNPPPLVFLTGRPDLTEFQVMELGAKGLLFKPFNAKRLINFIKLELEN